MFIRMLQLTEAVTDLLEEACAENCTLGSAQEQSGNWPFYISAIEIVVGAHSRESGAKETGYLHYGLDDGFITSLCAGIKKGLQSVVSHPVADVRVSITNAIVSEIESSPQSFEWLGQWLTEALLVEACKRGIISRI